MPTLLDLVGVPLAAASARRSLAPAAARRRRRRSRPGARCTPRRCCRGTSTGGARCARSCGAAGSSLWARARSCSTCAATRASWPTCARREGERARGLRDDLTALAGADLEPAARRDAGALAQRDRDAALARLPRLDAGSARAAGDPRDLIGAHVHLERARALAGAARWEDGERELDAMLAADPENVAALAQRAQVRLRLRRPAEARADLARVLELDPEDASAYRTLAQIELAAGAPEKALELARAGAGEARRVREPARNRSQRAGGARAAGRGGRAARRAPRRAPGRPRPAARAGVVPRSLPASRRRRESCSRARWRSTRSTSALAWRSPRVLRGERRRRAAAVAVLEAYLRIDPSNPDVLLRLGTLRLGRARARASLPRRGGPPRARQRRGPRDSRRLLHPARRPRPGDRGARARARARSGGPRDAQQPRYRAHPPRAAGGGGADAARRARRRPGLRAGAQQPGALPALPEASRRGRARGARRPRRRPRPARRSAHARLGARRARRVGGRRAGSSRACAARRRTTERSRRVSASSLSERGSCGAALALLREVEAAYGDNLEVLRARARAARQGCGEPAAARRVWERIAQLAPARARRAPRRSRRSRRPAV